MKLNKVILSFVIFSCIIPYFFNINIKANDESEIIILNEINEPNIEIQEERELPIYSEAAILIESKTGKILYEKDASIRKYPASTTKVLTAILAIENCDLNEKATATYTAINSVKSGYSIANIRVGEEFTIGELLDVLMLQSANEAANIIAEHVSGSISEFTKLMNKKAKEIGCLDSNFVNTNGAHNENHYSTAYDLAMITRYCMKNETYRNLVSKMECSLPTTEIYTEERKFRNTNSLMQQDNKYYYPYCNGGKTGFTTPAKNCLISSSNKDGFELISVILHAEATEEGLSARYLDTINLFEYGYNNFNQNDIYEEYDLIEYTANNSNIEENTLQNNFYENKEDIYEQEKSEQEIINFEKVDENIVKEQTIEIAEAVKKDYASVEKENNIFAWIQIFLGTAIMLFVIIKYYIYKEKVKTEVKYVSKIIKKDDLYDFKLN